MSLPKYDTMPDGWKLDRTFGSPEHGYVPICSGKSLISGGKKGLLKREVSKMEITTPTLTKPEIPAPIIKVEISAAESKAAARLVNDLARAKFKEKILHEILFDMGVCRIEGWDIREYAAELKGLIDGITAPTEQEVTPPLPQLGEKGEAT